MTNFQLQPSDALLVVDVQNDFCPGGALAVAEGDRVVPVLNRSIEAAQRAGAAVYASRDWHPEGHVSFKSRGGEWPPHCVQNTPGADFHPDLRLPSAAVIVSKGQHPDKDAYSAFDGTDLADKLKARGTKRLLVGGLALDYCVRASVLDALKAGWQTHLLLPATRAVNVSPDDGDRAVREMEAAGAALVNEEPA